MLFNWIRQDYCVESRRQSVTGQVCGVSRGGYRPDSITLQYEDLAELNKLEPEKLKLVLRRLQIALAYPKKIGG